MKERIDNENCIIIISVFLKYCKHVLLEHEVIDKSYRLNHFHYYK